MKNGSQGFNVLNNSIHTYGHLDLIEPNFFHVVIVNFLVNLQSYMNIMAQPHRSR